MTIDYGGLQMINIKGSTNDLYDMIIKTYDAASEGDKNLTIELKFLKGYDISLLQDFLSLLADLVKDFGLEEPEIKYEYEEGATPIEFYYQ